MLKAYIFDLEGTLVDFQWNLELGMEATRRKVGELGFAKEKLAKWDSWDKLYNGAVVEALLGRVNLTPTEVRDAIGEVFDYWDLDAASRWRLRDNAKETLKELHRKATVGMFTSVGLKAAKVLLQKYGIEGLFHIVVTRNETTLTKPYDEGLRLILNCLNISPQEMVFIGDTIRDVSAAKGVGAKSAYITGGEQEMPRDANPDYVIHSMSDILKIK